MNYIILVCNLIIGVSGAVGVFITAYNHYKKPTKDLEKRIDKMDDDIKEIKRKLDNDYTSINANREDMNLLMRSLFCLIENKLTGNNVDGLKKTRDDLINALTDKQVV